ncbi:hypothetical protein Ae201684P_016615 [Aphanomyces euteiches]|nr:hypothetical protein Ae201684P_016615 [Aphanomyces euteiches]
MLVVDDSSPSSSKLKVMMRSYKHEQDREASIDSFVSSHVVKCVGEWTGKGNLHTYPNAFVVETLQSKLFHCSADTPEAKQAWLNSISVYDRLSLGSSVPPTDVPTPTNGYESSEAPEPVTESPPSVVIPARPIERSRPKSERDALFQPKSRRSNFDDIEIEDETTGPRDPAVGLDKSLWLKASATTLSIDEDDDIPFVHVEAPPSSLRMKYTTTPAAEPPLATPTVVETPEEYIELDPDMVARFSHMRMMEARGQASAVEVSSLSRPSKRVDRSKKSKKKTNSSPVDDHNVIEKSEKKKKKSTAVTIDSEEPIVKLEKKKKKKDKTTDTSEKKKKKSTSEPPPMPLEEPKYYPEPAPIAPPPPRSIQLPAIDDF